MNKANSGGYDNKKSHFIMIPVEDQAFSEAYRELVNNIKASSLSNISPYLFQKDGKLHLTVCTLNIGEDKWKIDKYTKFLSEISGEINKISKGGVTFNFDKYSTLGEGQNTRVVYVKMKEDQEYSKLSDTINFIITSLVAKNLLNEEEITQNFIVYDSSTNRYSINLHLTILNILFLNKIIKKSKGKPLKSFDSTQLLKYLENKTLPSAKITYYNFCRMREDKKTEKYEVINSYNL